VVLFALEMEGEFLAVDVDELNLLVGNKLQHGKTVPVSVRPCKHGRGK
jgi:hypothetical protein